MDRHKRRKNNTEYQDAFEELKDKIDDLETELTKANEKESINDVDIVKINRLVKSVWSLAGIFLSIVMGASYIYIESQRIIDAVGKHDTEIVEIRKDDKRLFELIQEQSDINNIEITKIVHSTVDDRLGDIVEIAKQASEDAADAKELVEEETAALIGMNKDIRNNYKYLLQHKEEIGQRLNKIDKKLRK